jgi:hypothetical protein
MINAAQVYDKECLDRLKERQCLDVFKIFPHSSTTVIKKMDGM